MKKIKCLRKKIDCVDKRILKLLAKRFVLTDKIGGIKKLAKIEIEDKSREVEILEKFKKLSQKFNLDKNFTTNLLQLILQESKKRQK
ncbi:MAG: chorismate mutase [Patescibacteria group bacterium]|nr:chorismate mutase [Patescibacteria group bacterium]